MKHVPDHREHWRNSGKQKISYRERKKKGKGRDGEKGEQGKGKEGDSWKNDRMGASFPPFHLRGESGKSQSSRARNGRSLFYVDKSVCLHGEVVTERERG